MGIGFGSNLGDRLLNLQQAKQRLLSWSIIDPSVLCAPLFQSSPVDCAESAPDFLNTVVEIQVPSTTDPEQILAGLRGIETSLGRPSRRPKNSSRTIDLDLLYAGTLTRHTPALMLPHPRLRERRFVLAPLAAICPALVLPGQTRSVDDLLQCLPDDASVRRLQDFW